MTQLLEHPVGSIQMVLAYAYIVKFSVAIIADELL